MEFAMYFSPRSRTPEDQSPLLGLVEELSLLAEVAGFNAVFLTEHHLSINNPYQNSLQYAAYLAGKLNRMYLGLSTVSPALHHPLRIVEQCNLLDRLTGGRLVVGLGSGYVDDEYRAFGRRPEDRSALFDETVDVMLRMWAFGPGDEPMDFRTPTESGRVVRPVTPGPHRRPHPILGRATMTDATLVDTARRGWPALVALWDAAETRSHLESYFAALDDAGHPEDVDLACRRWTATMKWVHVAETDAQAWDEVSGTIERWLADVQTDADHASPEIASTRTDDIAQRRVKLGKQLVVGSPDTVVGQLEEYAAAGLGTFLCMFLRDVHEADAVRRSVELFSRSVMPKFSTDGPGGSAGWPGRAGPPTARG